MTFPRSILTVPTARPHGPRWRALAGLASLLLLGALAGCAGSTGAGTAPVRLLGPSPEFHGIWLEQPLPEPNVTLTDTSGKPFNLRQATAGRLTLVYFGYTHCPDVCPTTMADLASALRDLAKTDRDKISVVFITTDPDRDTPKVIKSWLASFDTSFVGLTGDYSTIQSAAKSVGIALEQPTSKTGDYEVTHGAEVIAFDGSHQGRLIFSSGTSSADYTTDLHKLLGRVSLATAAPAADAQGATS
jgi:protein SCO1